MTENPTSAACAEVRAWQRGKSLDPANVRMQIEMLRVRCPDLWDNDDEALLTDMLEGETSLHDFMGRLIWQVKEAEGAVLHAKHLISESKKRQAKFERRIEALRELALRLMLQAEVKKLELVLGTISVRSGVQKVVVTDEAALPDNCVRIKREPNKILIKELIDQGVPVAGATLSNAEPILAIR
jgi:ribosomal protein S18 acetylase RimI-like enzyme